MAPARGARSDRGGPRADRPARPRSRGGDRAAARRRRARRPRRPLPSGARTEPRRGRPRPAARRRSLCPPFYGMHALTMLAPFVLLLLAAPPATPSAFESIAGRALTDGATLATVTDLADRIGPRLSGSEGAAEAVRWGVSQ